MNTRIQNQLPLVDKTTIIHGLQALGIKPGMGLIVHSSLRSFGHVENGATTVIDALMELITENGTLLMPSFNHGLPFKQSSPGIFDPLVTPTTNGVIANTFWQLPNVHRSLDPTHAFAAWGKHTRRYIEYHHRTLTMGPESPLGLLLADDGYCLMLGVDYSSNTFHHVVEMSLGAPCLGCRTEAYPVFLPDGRQVLGRTWGWRSQSCPFTDGTAYVKQMQNIHQQGTIGTCRATLYRLKEGFSVVGNLLSHGGGGFPPCRQCPIRPRQTPQTVPSDWDFTTRQLRPDSIAFTY